MTTVLTKLFAVVGIAVALTACGNSKQEDAVKPVAAVEHEQHDAESVRIHLIESGLVDFEQARRNSRAREGYLVPGTTYELGYNYASGLYVTEKPDGLREAFVTNVNSAHPTPLRWVVDCNNYRTKVKGDAEWDEVTPNTFGSATAYNICTLPSSRY